jgi:hypothetical protein
MPVWRFRASTDLVFQIQPRPTTEVQPGIDVLFRGIAVAIERGTATAAMLTQSQFEFEELWARRHFEIIQRAGDKRWHLNRRGGFHHRRAGGGLFTLDRRLAKVFTGSFFDELTPESMLSPQCLVCGMSLSDPVSMARGVGPCCAAMTTNVMPFVLTKKRTLRR